MEKSVEWPVMGGAVSVSDWLSVIGERYNNLLYLPIFFFPEQFLFQFFETFLL